MRMARHFDPWMLRARQARTVRRDLSTPPAQKNIKEPSSVVGGVRDGPSPQG